jgi:hypothetical protein
MTDDDKNAYVKSRQYWTWTKPLLRRGTSLVDGLLTHGKPAKDWPLELGSESFPILRKNNVVMLQV